MYMTIQCPHLQLQWLLKDVLGYLKEWQEEAEAAAIPDKEVGKPSKGYGSQVCCSMDNIIRVLLSVFAAVSHTHTWTQGKMLNVLISNTV